MVQQPAGQVAARGKVAQSASRAGPAAIDGSDEQLGAAASAAGVGRPAADRAARRVASRRSTLVGIRVERHLSAAQLNHDERHVRIRVQRDQLDGRLQRDGPRRAHRRAHGGHDARHSVKHADEPHRVRAAGRDRCVRRPAAAAAASSSPADGSRSAAARPLGRHWRLLVHEPDDAHLRLRHFRVQPTSPQPVDARHEPSARPDGSQCHFRFQSAHSQLSPIGQRSVRHASQQSQLNR